jgi:N-acetylmuramoyl-L-alanine amidase
MNIKMSHFRLLSILQGNRTRRLKLTLAGLMFLCGLSTAFSAVLQSMTVNESPGKTSIVCYLSDIPSYRGFFLAAPHRAVVDLNQTTSKLNFNQIPVTHRFIESIRGGMSNAKSLRLVFDLKQPMNVKIVNWKTGMNGPQGIRIDLTPKNFSVQPTPTYQAPQASSFNPVPHPYAPAASHVTVQRHAASQPIQINHAPPKGHRDVVVVIDAGHGGKDPGARGPRRNVEKNVVLAIAYKLKQRIDREPGMRAVMTRDGDYYVGLRERLNIARKHNADMFVSIHADAFNNRNSNGASVYALSPTGATSEAARWLAEKENYSELGGVDLSGLDDRNGLIRTVLLDLSQTATINAGLQIGDRVLGHLDRMTTLHHNKVEQARFVVLKSPDIPSILVETGFISNPREEFNLTSPAYQTRLAQAVFEGVKRYFWDSPPPGSRIEAMAGGGNVIARADSRPMR